MCNPPTEIWAIFILICNFAFHLFQSKKPNKLLMCIFILNMKLFYLIKNLTFISMWLLWVCDHFVVIHWKFNQYWLLIQLQTKAKEKVSSFGKCHILYLTFFFFTISGIKLECYWHTFTNMKQLYVNAIKSQCVLLTKSQNKI